jgi:hypothetical protein
VALGALRVRRLRLLDTETPDAPADAATWFPVAARMGRPAAEVEAT